MNVRLFPFLSSVTTFALVLAGVLSSQVPAPTPLTLLSKEGRRPIAVTMVGDHECVALDDLAAIFLVTVREESFGAITVSYKGKTIVLTADQALASVSGRLVSLPAAPSRSGRRWLVPVEFINRALALIYDARLDLRKASHLLILGDLRVPRVMARYDLVGPGGRLTIDVTPRANSTVEQDSDRLTIKFEADALDIANPLLAPQGAQSLVQTMRVVDPTTIEVALGPKAAGFRAATQPIDATMRLVIDLAAQAETATTAPAPAPPPQPDVLPTLGQPTALIRTIAIDPGHGGNDEGVRTADGTKEKDLTLAVARRAKGAIEGRLGIRVLLTRDDDRNVPIDERTALANNNKAELFVSLHVNASLRKSAAGASIYCAAFDDESAKGAMAAKPERVPTFGGGSRDIELVLWDLAQIRHVDRSTAFATILADQLRNRVPLAGREVQCAPLRVLESANMPAVLVEMGFLSNPDQEKQLLGAEFQNAFGQALHDAVVKFRDSISTGATR